MKQLTVLAKILLAVMLCLCTVSCAKAPKQDVWESATYTEDVLLGKGAKTVQVEVTAEEKSVTFTLNTDKETLGDALAEHDLISGEKSTYGLYVKVVNGITADYDKDKSYWAFTKSGESMQTGVDGEKISGGEHYELVRTKQ